MKILGLGLLISLLASAQPKHHREKFLLEFIALSPLTVTLSPGATQQLTVTATYSDGLTESLWLPALTFASSNTSVATVSTSGVVTVATNGANGASSTITATVAGTSMTTSPARSTIVSVNAPPTGIPTTTSISAATLTATNNALCTAVRPFYWEIGNQNAALASGSVGTDSSGAPVLASTTFSIASASKWMYGTYVVQLRGAASALTAQDINFLHFTSGYTNMGNAATGSECPSTNIPDTVNACLALLNPSNGLPYSYQDPATVGKFDYDGGHMENHASQYGGLGTVADLTLGTTVGNLLASNIKFVYTEPLLAGGIYTSANDYATVLRNILKGSLAMHDALGIDPVCTLPSAKGCNAVSSPLPEAWHYSIGHWVEDDPSTNGDGTFSSAGAFGFYPWIEASKVYYGVLSRQQASGTGEQNGYQSAKCGRLIRRAWDTGVQQTGTIPN